VLKHEDVVRGERTDTHHWVVFLAPPQSTGAASPRVEVVRLARMASTFLSVGVTAIRRTARGWYHRLNATGALRAHVVRRYDRRTTGTKPKGRLCDGDAERAA